MSEITEGMVDAAHAVLANPQYLRGDRRNTRDALRAALNAKQAAGDAPCHFCSKWGPCADHRAER